MQYKKRISLGPIKGRQGTREESIVSIQIRKMPVQLLVAMALILILAGCVTPSTSTGFHPKGIAGPALPPEIPNPVGVVPFSGDPGISIQATDQFANSLIELGFDVIERQELNALVGELAFQQSELVNPETRQKLREQLGVKGLFVGSVTGESSELWVDFLFEHPPCGR